MCIMVGKLSLEDWPRLTWSFGWTGLRLPKGEPSSSLARFEMTSLAFMLVWVPEPVCQTGRGKSASRRPSAISCAASRIGPASSPGELAEALVGLGAGPFVQADGADQQGREMLRADPEQPAGALRLRAPVAPGGDVDAAEAVGFGAGIVGHASIPLRSRSQR